VDLDKMRDLLAARWASKEREVKDYACNAYAEDLAILHNLKDIIRDPQLKEALDLVMKWLRREGTARWVRQADILTNLALKVGERKQVLPW